VALASESLLEGEDSDTRYAQDARHWVAIYTELIAFRSSILARVHEQVRKLPPSSRAAASAADVRVIEAQLMRYRRRLEFWYGRQWAMEGLFIDQGSRTIVHRDRSVMLTRREYQLFMTLVARPSSHTRSAQLLVEAWHDTGLPEETLRTYIVRLRRKLAALRIPVRIENKPRHGYALVFDDPAATRITRQSRD
jgi:DNA-binding response OmpR family regulator